MIDAANYSATETLRDGRTVEIRAQRSQDREGMQAAIARSSSGSLYRRFFAVRREFSEKETDYFLDIDFVNHVALVAVANDAGQLAENVPMLHVFERSGLAMSTQRDGTVMHVTLRIA